MTMQETCKSIGTQTVPPTTRPTLICEVVERPLPPRQPMPAVTGTCGHVAVRADLPCGCQMYE